MARHRFNALASLKVQKIYEHLFSVKMKSALSLKTPGFELPYGTFVVCLSGDFHKAVSSSSELIEENFVNVARDTFPSEIRFERAEH